MWNHSENGASFHSNPVFFGIVWVSKKKLKSRVPLEEWYDESNCSLFGVAWNMINLGISWVTQTQDLLVIMRISARNDGWQLAMVDMMILFRFLSLRWLWSYGMQQLLWGCCFIFRPGGFEWCPLPQFRGVLIQLWECSLLQKWWLDMVSSWFASGNWTSLDQKHHLKRDGKSPKNRGNMAICIAKSSIAKEYIHHYIHR